MSLKEKLKKLGAETSSVLLRVLSRVNQVIQKRGPIWMNN